MLFGQYHTLMTVSPGDFVNYMRMPPAMCQDLLQRITTGIQKRKREKRPIEPRLKLAITLRYKVTGNSYNSLQYFLGVAHNIMALFIPEVGQVIIDK